MSVFYEWLLTKFELRGFDLEYRLTTGDLFAKLMLELMSPQSWFWFSLISLMVISLFGDWWTHRFRDLSDNNSKNNYEKEDPK